MVRFRFNFKMSHMATPSHTASSARIHTPCPRRAPHAPSTCCESQQHTARASLLLKHKPLPFTKEAAPSSMSADAQVRGITIRSKTFDFETSREIDLSNQKVSCACVFCARGVPSIPPPDPPAGPPACTSLNSLLHSYWTMTFSRLRQTSADSGA